MIKIVKKKTVILIVLCISLGFYLCYHFFIGAKKSKETWIVPNVQDMSKKFISKEILVNEIQQKQELITMEIQMTEKVTLDDSWGNLSILKKVQSINYSGTGTYVVDLSTLKPENIDIDDNNKKITVKASAPTIKGVSINQDKTEYQSPENGTLRFGEIKLTLEEANQLEMNVKEKMKKKMSEQDFMSQAVKSSEDTLKGLVKTIIENQTKDNYDISVNLGK